MTRRRPEGNLRSLRFRRLICGGLVTATLLAGTPGVSAPGGMRLVGYFDRRNAKAAVAANGNILIDAAARRAYQAVAVSDTTIFEYDLDTMLVLRSVTIPLLMVADTRAGPVEWLWTLDEVNRRIFTFERRQGSSETYHLMIIDLATLSIGPVVDLWPLGNRLPLAISYDAQSDSVYLMTMVANINLLPNRGEVYFVEQRTASGRLDWEYRLASCFGAQDQQYPPTLVRSQIQRQFIYLNCYNSGGVQGQIVRLHLRADGQVESGADEVFPAVPPAFSTMFDRGSDRMFFLTTNSGAGRGAWVFDGLRSTFLGVIATGDSKGGFDYSMGLDPVTGRLYLHSPIGLVVADARRTPLGGGLVFHEYAGFGTGAIQVDPATRHVFVPDTTSRNSVGQPLRYMVLADELQASSATVIPDPDALTTDVAEAPNVTGVNFSGAASAFGLRTLTTGGLQRGAWNIALGQFSTDELQVVWTGVQTVPLDEGNREFHAARVRSVSLTNTGADADAVVSEVDEATRTDLNQVETDWPAQSAECHDAGGAPDDGIGDQGLAVASCNVGTRSVSASAGVPTLAFDSPTVAVSARALQAASSVSHDSAKGLVSHSSAVVRDLSIAGKVRLAELSTEAQTWAKGRRGSADSSFDRRIVGLQVDADGDGVFEDVCDVCSVDAAREAMNRALIGVGSVDFPSPDGEYLDGSPGGFQAVVEKDRHQFYADRALNDDDSQAVVGLMFFLQSDARAGRSRQIVQIAGVQAESHYGIYLLPTAASSQREEVRNDLLERVIERVPATPDPPAPPPSLPIKAKEIIDRFVERVAQGWRVFVAKPGDALLMAALLSFLLLPLYLVSRRRELGS